MNKLLELTVLVFAILPVVAPAAKPPSEVLAVCADTLQSIVIL